jgi:TM2 domain-containing membrane protein YozV
VSELVGPDALRIGTQEREDAVRVLGEHFAAGRLSVDEYEKRVTEALESQTRGDLRPLFVDLPAPYPAFMIPPAPPPLVTMPAYPPAPYGVAYSDKNKLAAGLLQIVLPFGIGRFYTGHTGIALAQLFTSLIFVGVIWSFVDGIVLLVSGGTDGQGRRLRDS